MVLSEEGKVFYTEALRAVEQTMCAEERITAKPDLKAGHLLVGHSTNFPARFLAAINRNFDNSPTRVQIEHVSDLPSKSRGGWSKKHFTPVLAIFQ